MASTVLFAQRKIGAKAVDPLIGNGHKTGKAAMRGWLPCGTVANSSRYPMTRFHRSRFQRA
ncbi:MAG: hypothetical protein NUV77_06750, partial [Thermoguttaceae bacterium]|nr:hypothetical protein [Thermoguttaceae bacterium]